MDLGLTGVHVLVTGASGGIGLETTRLFLEQGAKVTAHYNTKLSPLEPLLSEYDPAVVQAVQANLSNESDVTRLFDSASTWSGPIQVIIINHAIGNKGFVPLWEISLDRWKRTLDGNLTSSFLVSREYLLRLKDASEEVKEKASMVLVGSTAGKYGEAGNADYAASKSAIMYGLALSLKNEIVKIAPKGRVNVVGPGWVKTLRTEVSINDPIIVYRALATTPLKKVGQPRDIASHIVILSSQVVSGHISGQVLMIEGGMEGRLLNLPSDLPELSA